MWKRYVILNSKSRRRRALNMSIMQGTDSLRDGHGERRLFLDGKYVHILDKLDWISRNMLGTYHD